MRRWSRAHRAGGQLAVGRHVLPHQALDLMRTHAMATGIPLPPITEAVLDAPPSWDEGPSEL